jgi:uncharacterized protein
MIIYMKEPNFRKHFFYFILLAQLLGFFLHYIIFVSLTTFFPFFAHYYFETALALGLLCVGFLFFNIIDHLMDNPIVRAGYILSAIWLPLGMYLIFASAFTLFVNYTFKNQIPFSAHIIFSFAFLFIVYGIINARILKVREVTVTLPNLPEFWKNKTAVLASDLHFGHVLKKPSAYKLVKKVNALNPDIVFIPGDFFDGAKSDFAGVAKIVGEIKAPLGIYFTSGNHEIIAGLEICNQAIANAGIVLLENKKIEIEGLQILGTAYSGKETTESLSEVLKNLQINPEKPSILLKHVPDHLDAVTSAGVSLQLSGHTHLGQMWPFNYLTKKVFNGFDYGLKNLNKTLFYTSSGVGTWGPPVRVFTNAEIVKIEFK